jgi:hypothetical protein
MAIRIRYSISIAVSSSSAEDKDLGNAKYEVVTDLPSMGGGWKTLVPANATDIQLRMDNLANVQFLLLRTNVKDPTLDPVSLTFKRNTTGGEAIVIKPLGDAKEGHLAMSTTGLTALYATNSSTTDMEVTLFVAGD